MSRELKYKTVEELEKAIDAYFEECKDKVIKDEDGNIVTDKSGNPVLLQNPPTVSGLALFLGFEDRQSIYDYKNRGEFSCTIKRAIMRIANYAEQHLYIGKATGAIFWLKNHGWADKRELDGSFDITQLVIEAIDDKTADDEDSGEVSALNN
jgi:hypothetical protein